MTTLPPTPGQTVGPFFGVALPYPGDGELVSRGAPGAVRLFGRVLDGDGQPVPDALIELWQPAPNGTVAGVAGSLDRDGWSFTGWGRAATDRTGGYGFTTVVPPGGYADLTVFARGVLDRLVTRVYFGDPGDGSRGDGVDDPVLAAVPAERRATLVATPGPDGFRFDIHLQGEHETVFLHFRPGAGPGR